MYSLYSEQFNSYITWWNGDAIYNLMKWWSGGMFRTSSLPTRQLADFIAFERIFVLLY